MNKDRVAWAGKASKHENLAHAYRLVDERNSGVATRGWYGRRWVDKQLVQPHVCPLRWERKRVSEEVMWWRSMVDA